MHSSLSRFARLPFLLVAAGIALAASTSLIGCKPTSSTIPAWLTADDSFVIHDATRYNTQDTNDVSTLVVVIETTYTNKTSIQQAIRPERFQLLDLNMGTQYNGMNGGNIHVPQMTYSYLDPGKSIDLTLGFRVSTSISSARLAYTPL